MGDLESWLAERLAGAPTSLREQIMRSVRSAQGVELTAIAEELLEQAKSGPPTRDTAMTLLAADALITLAVEAKADE